MICPNCGANISRKTRFCQECGSRQEVKNIYAEKVLPLTKWIALGYVALYLLCILACALSVAIKPVIKLNNYLCAEFSGFDKYGSVNVSMDVTRLAEDHGKKLSFGAKTEEERMAAAMDFASAISIQTDAPRFVTNGDVINCVLSCNEEAILQRFNVKVKYSDAQFTVEGLQQPSSFDPFEGLDVKFEGTEPYGQAQIVGEATHEAADELYFRLDTHYDLRNNMTVKLFVDGYNENMKEYLVTRYGALPSSLEKSFQVKGLSYYAADLAEISDEAVAQMQAKATEKFNGTLTGDHEELKSFNLHATYLVTDSKYVDNWFNNELYLVYQVKILNEYQEPVPEEPSVTPDTGTTPDAGTTPGEGTEPEPEPQPQVFSKVTEFYWFISFENLLTNDAGDLQFNVDSYESARNRITVDSGIATGWFSTKRWNYYGYETLDALYEDVIADAAEKYVCVSKVAG